MSLKRKGVPKNRLLKPHKNKDGYLRVYLTKEKTKDIGYTIHRLVASAFIPNPDNKPEVDHLNCVRDDNRVENLCWVTHKENCNNPITRKNCSISSTIQKYAMSEKRISKLREAISGKPSPLKGIHRLPEVREKIAKAHCKRVKQYSLDGVFIKEWESIQIAAEETETSRRTIEQIASGKRYKFRKYIWKFV